ncbi:ABC transporter substrate-binding protein [Shewanella sp.]|uniref:ABC transporter substrate-binding protein n=1 Tax=Shewanella sp. TaxID=50422 RepID=UPI003A89868C
MRLWYLSCLFIGLLCSTLPAWAKLEVAFFNPGAATDSFWGDVDKLMEVAATQLDINLKIIHSDRNHFKMITQLEVLLNSSSPVPTHIILVNEKQSAIKMLQMLYRYPIYVQLILNDISVAERETLLADPHWRTYLLPAIIPDNYAIGAETAKTLLSGLQDKKAKVLLISGDKSTPASVLRTQGANDHFFMQPNVTVTQTVYGQWREDIAYGQVLTLLSRYPDLNLIWTASDNMAMGVVKALNEKGLRPGRDVLVSSVNTSAEILQLRQSQQITTLGGGHFLAGALGLVQLKHYQATHDYYPYTDIQLFSVLNPNSDFYRMLVNRDWVGIFQTQILDKLPQQ